MTRYLTTAAGLLLAISACVVFAVLLRTQSTAFARMIEPILEAKTVRFNLTMELKALPKQTIRMMVSGAGKMRQELSTGQIQIIDSDAGKFVMLNPADNSAMSFNTAVMPAQQRPPNYFDLLRTGLRSAGDGAAVGRESLGKKQIDGREAVGYRVKLKESNGELTIWGDPATGSPIVAEMKLAMFPDGKFTMTDFEFDIELDETLFSTQVPSGYTLVERTISKPTETDMIAGLKLVAEHNAGRFPDVFGNSAIGPLISDFVKKNPGPPDAAWKEKVMQLSQPFTQALAFALSLPADSNARYAGKEVKLGDAAAAIFWYKPAGAKAYRVICGDLSVKEQKDAPESPNAVPITFGFSIDSKTKKAASVGARRNQSTNKMKLIGIALLTYHDVYRHFPPAVVMGPDGKTPHSWRVEILPYLEENKLYGQYRMNEPWDSEHNKKLIEATDVFSVPGETPSKDCGYFLATGPGTAFDPLDKPSAIRSITDGTSRTIAVVEAKRSIPWTKPEDIEFDPNKLLPKLGGFFEGGFHAARFDASVQFLPQDIDEKTLRALVSSHSGDGITDDPAPPAEPNVQE